MSQLMHILHVAINNLKNLSKAK